METGELFLKINQKVLRTHYHLLENSLDAEAVAGALFAKQLITSTINSQLGMFHTTTLQKNRILLQHLMTNSTPDLIPQLCEILNQDTTKRHLASLLKGYIICLSGLTSTHFVTTLYRSLYRGAGCGAG